MTKVTVLGAGVLGLSCASRLQESGYQVTIYARDLPEDLHSQACTSAFTLASGPRSLHFDKSLHHGLELTGPLSLLSKRLVIMLVSSYQSPLVTPAYPLAQGRNSPLTLSER